MNPTFSFIDQGNPDQLFRNLRFAIEEIKLLRKISDLEDLQLQLKSTLAPQQVKVIRRKIEVARVRLEVLRLKAEKQMKFSDRL